MTVDETKEGGCDNKLKIQETIIYVLWSERTVSMNCGYKLQMISMLLYLSILGDMCKHRDVVRAIGAETYTYTMNRWGEKCCTKYCTRNVLYTV